MVVIAVLSIVIGLIYSIFISQMQTSSWRARLAERGQNLKAAMNVMTGDLLEAEGIVDTPGLCNTAIAMRIGSETLTYSAIGNALVRDSSETGKATLAKNITDLGFECFDRSGNGMLSVNSTSAIEVRRVSISLTGETSKSRPGTTTPAKQTLTSSVELRNIPQTAGKGCGVLYFDLSPKEVAFCDPPGNQTNISVYLCNLKGEAMGGDVKIFPREPQPVSIKGANVTEVNNTAVLHIADPGAGTDCKDSTTEGVAIVNAGDSSHPPPAGTGIEMVAVWRPQDCTYDITTSRSISVAAGYPYKFKAGLEVFPGVLNSCQSTQQAIMNATVEDKCGNGISGTTVNFDVLDSGGNIVTGDPDWGTTGAATDMGDGLYTSVYNTGDVARTVTLQAEAPAIVNASNRKATSPVTLLGAAPAAFEEVSSPFSLTLNECPNTTDSVTFRVVDECGNALTGQEGSISSSLSPDRGTTYTDVVSEGGAEYKAVYNTPASCGDGNIDTDMIISHSAGFSNTAHISLGQCPMPGLDVTRTSVPPHRVARGCGRLSDPNNPTTTVRTTVRDNASCDPWPVDTKFQFEVINCGHDPIVCVTGSNFNGSWEDAGTTKIVFSGIGWAEQKLLGLNDAGSAPFPPDVGDFLKVRAKAWVRYDSAEGTYDTMYEDSYYNNDAANLVEVVAPDVDITFTESSYSGVADSISTDCAAASSETVYFQIDDCDADLGPSVTAVVNSITSEGATRDSEALTLAGGSGLYNGSVRTSVTAGGAADDGILKIGSSDTITVFYTDDTDSSVHTESIGVSGFYDGFEGDTSGWSIQGTHKLPDPQWHVAVDPVLGDEAFQYNDGTDFSPLLAARNYGTLVSPEFPLDTSAGNQLVFTSRADIECSTKNTCVFDTHMVFINSASAPAWRLLDPPAADADDDLGCSSGDAVTCSVRASATKTFNFNHPQRVAMDLSGLPAADFDGQEVRLMFRFDSWDSVLNNYAGWIINDSFVGCGADTTAPAAPVIAGDTLSATKVRLTWDPVAGASGYSLFAYSFAVVTPGDKPFAQVRNLTPNCTEPGKVCYEYTTALTGMRSFTVLAFDDVMNLSDFSNVYEDESDSILRINMTCYDKVSSGILGKNKVIVKGTVTDLDGTPVSGATASFEATGDNSLATDSWSFITNASGVYCGDNEEDGTPTPFTSSDNLINTQMWAMSPGYTDSAVRQFQNPGACSCP
jgi:hypothetical protein